MLAIANEIMKEEDVTSINDWLCDHFRKSTVCTLALWFAGYKTRETTNFIKNRAGVLECCDDGTNLTLRDLHDML